MPSPESPLAGEVVAWRHRLHEVIFEADTRAGKAFDVALLVAILASVTAVLLESVVSVSAVWGRELRALEWAFTALFTVEYVLRLLTVKRPIKYAGSFYGVVDLLALLPSYLSVIFVGAQSLLVIRAIRLLRVFRVLKLAHFLGEAQYLTGALRASMRKILVFLSAVVTTVLLVGSLMYLIEGADSGFTSIPRSMYWAIVTMTTVGYGDIAPQTIPGQLLASVVMVLGYGIIAVPTGIVTAELTRSRRGEVSTQACRSCSAEGHVPNALFCHGCGAKL